MAHTQKIQSLQYPFKLMSINIMSFFKVHTVFKSQIKLLTNQQLRKAPGELQTYYCIYDRQLTLHDNTVATSI